MIVSILSAVLLLCPTITAQPGSNNVSDKELDCAVRSAALAYARHLQPQRPLTDVFDGLQLGTYCGEPPPPPLQLLPSSPARVDVSRRRAQTISSTASVFYADALRGDDNAPGSAVAPFRSIARGVVACRTAAAPPCSILLNGTFYLNETLELDSRDSSLTISATPGGTAVLSGGAPLEGAQWTAVDIAPPNNVWRMSLPPSFVPPLALLVGGRRTPRARWPNGDADVDIVPTGYTGAAGWLPPRPPVTPPVPVPGNFSRPEDVYFPSYVWATGGVAVGNFEPPEGYWISSSPTAGDTWSVPSGLNFSRANFSPRVGNWTAPNRAVVFAFHGGYWGSWAFSVDGVSLDAAGDGTLTFSSGGWQEARGWKTGGALYVDNIREELDTPGEWFYDVDTRELVFWYNATSGTPPPSTGAGTPVVSQIETLVRVSGDSPDAPAESVTLGPGLTFTATAPTYLKPFRAPSGGDWSFCETAAVEFVHTSHASVRGCSLVALGGNGVYIRGGNVGASVTDSEFRGLGESGIVVVGAAGGGQTPSLQDTPVGTLVARNVFQDLGIFVRQAGPVYTALSANTTILENIAFNLPRAAVNVNDGAWGGHVIAGNLFFATVRETQDHGAINSWEREPYVREFFPSGAPVLYGALSRCTSNFLISNGYGIHPLDHDDGSNAWLDERNVLAWAGVKNWEGFNKTASSNLIVRPDYCSTCTPGAHTNFGPGGVPLPTSFYFPVCARSLGQAAWGALGDTYTNNTCILANADPYIFGKCNASAPSAAGDVPRTHGNTFVTPNAQLSIACGGKSLSLADAQAVGYEVGSRAIDNALSPADTVAMIEALLGFSVTAL